MRNNGRHDLGVGLQKNNFRQLLQGKYSALDKNFQLDLSLMALSSGHSVKFVSLKDFLVEADLLLPKSLLCLEGGTTCCTAKGGSDNFVLFVI